MSNDNQSADAMALLVGLMDPPEVEEGNVARTSDRTSDLLSSEGLPLACFVQVASLIVSFMLLTMNWVVGDNNSALADSGQSSLSLITDLKIHACCGDDSEGLSAASFNFFLQFDLF